MSDRQDFYREISPQHLAPLWKSLHVLVPKEPATPCVPHLWSYADVRPYLTRSGDRPVEQAMGILREQQLPRNS